MRQLPLMLALAASLAGVCPASAQTHRFGVEDLIGREGVGQVRTSPDGRWVVVERQANHNKAATYRFQTMTYALLTELEIHAVDAASPTRRFAAAGRDVGYLAGPFSPSGARMVVIKVTEATYRMGILTLATGDVQWLPITPEQSQFGRSIAWRSETEVAVIARPLDDFPIQMRVGFQTQDRVEGLWRNAASGHASSGVYIPSGATRDARAQALPSCLILVNAETGSQRVLAHGEWFDMALSPDGRRLAALRNAEDIQPAVDRPLLVGDPIRRRRLAVIDLDSGVVSDPLPGEDLAMYLLSWSPDSSRLLAFGRPYGSADFEKDGRYWLIGRNGRAARLGTGEDRPRLQRTWDGVAIPLASWDGERPLVQVGETEQNRYWRRDDGARFPVRERPPVVVQIYPGRILTAAPPTILPGSRNPQNNPSVIAGAGYAVLIANLPDPASGPRLDDLADRIFAIVEEAGRRGLIDPDRVAVTGHSYGAYPRERPGGMARPSGHFAPVARSEPCQPFTAAAVHHDARFRRLIEDCIPALPCHQGGGASPPEASGDVAIIGDIDAVQRRANALSQGAEKRFGNGRHGLSARGEAQSGSLGRRERVRPLVPLAAECLEKVFGPGRVFRNIDIYGSGRNRVGEIDVLAIYGRRAILVQAKSKRLTIEARKGNDLKLKDDFKKAVQDAADQAFLCATALLDPSFKLKTAEGEEIELPRSFDVIHPLCIVSDHFPALAFQASEFLTKQTTEQIVAPLVMDVFALDVMAEMLASPLHFLHYLTLRDRFGDRVSASHELTLLGYHLTHHLWFDDEFDMMTLGDDFSVPLDIAMLARRDRIPGLKTPKGILTKLADTTFGRLIRQIESHDDPEVGELGFLLLQLGEQTARSLGSGIETLASAARSDRRPRDLSLEFGEAQSGLTVHCRYPDTPDTMPRLLAHCELRKYSTKANSWHGLLIHPDTLEILASVGSRETWTFDAGMEDLVKQWPIRPQLPWNAIKREITSKIGRNDPCPCGSGTKHKKCCLGRS